MIDLAPSATSEADASVTTEANENKTTDSTGGMRNTITSYKTVDGSVTEETGTAAQTTVPVLAGENSVGKLGIGAWTVAMVGFGSVITGLLI